MSKKLNKIENKIFFWFLLVGILPLISAILLIYFDQLKVIKKNTQSKLIALRDLKKESIEHWIEDIIADLNVISGNFEIKDISKLQKISLGNNEKEKILKISTGLLNRYLTFYDTYDELFILHPETGKVIISTDYKNIDVDKSYDDYFIETKKSNITYIKDIYYSNTDKKLSMVFAKPVYDENNQVCGILCLRCDLKNSLFPLLLNRTGLGETGETILINKEGYAISELKWKDNAPLKLKINAKPAKLAVAGNTGVIQIEDYRKIKVLAAYNHIEKMGWGFVCKMDIDELYKSINDMFYSLMLILLTSILFIAGVSFYLSKNISDPIINIVQVANRIKNGDIEARTVIQTDDEIGVLAAAINNMAYTINSKIKIQSTSIELSNDIASLSSLHDLGEKLLTAIEENTEAVAGALYCIDEIDGHLFKPVFSIGLDKAALECFDVQTFEGEIGKIAFSGKITRLTDIPDDTKFLFKTVSGSIFPKEIITIPLINIDTVTAVISIISTRPFSKESLEFIHQILPNINSSLDSIRSFVKVKRMSDELGDLNKELEARALEVQQQGEEIKTRNVELEQKHEELARSNKLKSEFLSNMSHELRTPLNSVIALSNVLLEKSTFNSSKEETKYLEIIERNGKKLLTLINDILDLSKIEAGKFEVTLSKFSVIEGLKRNLETISTLAEQKHLELRTDFDDILPLLQSDINKFDHIFLNLLNNALKFTEVGYISLTAENRGNDIIVSIKDTGIGIAKENIEHIFNEFQQIDGTSSRKFEGTGLGLAIVKKSIKMIGGKISVESELGKGTIFTVTLPILWKGTAEVVNNNFSGNTINHYNNELKNRSLQNHTTEQKTILLIEDNESAVIQITNMLENENYDIHIARNGKEALTQLDTFCPDGIILDLMMPEIDGFTFLERIRSKKIYNSLPVLILTAKDLTQEDYNKLSSNNVQELIFKGCVIKEEFLFKLSHMFIEKKKVVTKSRIKSSAPPESSKLLLIEDNPDNMVTMNAILGNKYDLLNASDGFIGLNMAFDHLPSLVLLDISLPAMDGFEVLKTLRSDSRTANIPVIAVTAMAMKNDLTEINNAGFDACITKPIDSKILLEKINEYL